MLLDNAVALLLAATLVSRWADALRSGAPTLACMNMRPIHGLYRGKPASASQFLVRQSSLSYAPGQNVTVEIMTQSQGRHFRGFMVQSYNPLDGRQIGHFLATEHAQPMTCSSATHRNNHDKQSVTITWVPPSTTPNTDSRSNPDSSATSGQPPIALGALGGWLGLPISNPGVQKRHAPTPTTPQPANQTGPLQQVRFRATIVVSYSEFYTDFESSERRFDRFDYSSAASHARGMVSVAVAVSPRENTTAIAVAGNKELAEPLLNQYPHVHHSGEEDGAHEREHQHEHAHSQQQQQQTHTQGANQPAPHAATTSHRAAGWPGQDERVQ